MSTIRAQGVEASLLGLLRALGVEEEVLGCRAGSKWRGGTRGWEGWINERDGEKKKIARVLIIWDVSGTAALQSHTEERKKRRNIFIRVHPSAFFQVWNEVLQLARIQRPAVMVEDLRFDIGSIEVVGPGSTEALISALRPIPENKTLVDASEVKPEEETEPGKIWLSLCEVTNPASLPPHALLSFEITDPRLHHPPRTVKSDISDEALLQILTTWPPDANLTNFALFDP